MENNNEPSTTTDNEALIREGAKMLVQEAIKRAPKEIPEAERAKYEELMLKIILENKSPMEAIGFSEEMIEHMYAYGYRLYNNGVYKKAKDMFTSLTIFKPDDARFYLGLGACLQHLEEWEDATGAYNTCSILDPESPMPFFYMYECLNQLNRYEDAAECLKETMKRCGDEEIFANIKERSNLLLEALNNEQKKVA